MIRLSGSSYSLILVIVVMLAVIGFSLRLEYFASKLLPLLIGSMVLVLAAIDLAREMKAGQGSASTATAAEKEGEGRTKKDVKEHLRVGAWIIGYSLAIYVVGFAIASLLFVGAYMKRHGSSWPAAVITTCIFTSIIYAVFNLALKADLPAGELLKWLGL